MNHYEWLEKNLQNFFDSIGADNPYPINGLLSSSGDKCYGYKNEWEEKGIPFYHGVALYLLTLLTPYQDEVRQTPNGWVPVDKWVIDNYPKFKLHLPEIK